MPLRPRSAFAVALGLVVAALAVSCSKDNSTAPITISGPGFNFGFPQVGASHQQTFPDVGSFGYQCSTHGSSMSGTVTVLAGAADSIRVYVGVTGADANGNGGTIANAFSPSTATIHTGGYVRWILVSGALTNHTATR